MYLRVNGMDFAPSYDFNILFWNYSDSMVFFVFIFFCNAI